MAAIPLERDGVVHILDGCCPSYRYAVLAQRISRDVSVPGFTPPVVITLVNCRVTLEASVTNVLGFNVYGAEPLRSEIVTARVGAEAFGFDRACSPPSTNVKSPQRATEKRLRVSA